MSVTVTPTLSNNLLTVEAPTQSNQVGADVNLINVVHVNSTADYNLLRNKPQIESVTLTGNKSFKDLGLTGITNMRLEQILNS